MEDTRAEARASIEDGCVEWEEIGFVVAART
jgi:hypothetical protein